MKSISPTCRLATAAAFVIVLFAPSVLYGAGFEVGEHTPRSTARGGTGAANTTDPSAVYFNPALLSQAGDSQLLVSSNFLRLSAEFQREDFHPPFSDTPQNFDRVENQHGIFPIPFLTATFNLGPENLSLGAGVFSPSAYGNPCWGALEDGECLPDRNGATRGMAVETDMIVVYLGAGAAYRFQLGDERSLDVGLTAALAAQNTDFAVVADANLDRRPPWREDPDNEVFVRGQDLRGFAPTAIFGLAYTDGPFRFGASFRPPIRWELSGTADVEFSEFLQGLETSLTDDGMQLDTWHAGSLRLGWGVVGGQHPADADRPRWDLEMNAVWENWSLVDNFRLELDGDVQTAAFQTSEGDNVTMSLYPVYQPKGYQDTLSLRTGFSYGVNSWLTAHTGGFLESAAQPLAYTSADFVSWERYAASVGASFQILDDLEFDVGYAFIYSPGRTVSNGRVYNPIPMSSCRGPDYDHEGCENPGTPPGNPQNEGQWNAHFQIFSAGLTWNY